MPTWLLADPGHVFWMQFMIALADGLLVVAAGAIGFSVFRWRERARHEEELRAELRKRRLDAVLAVIDAWTTHYHAHAEKRLLSSLLPVQAAQPGADREQLAEKHAATLAREHAALVEFSSVVLARSVFLPPDLAQACNRYVTAPDGTRQRERAFQHAEALFRAYLPSLPGRTAWWWRFRYFLSSRAGADDEADPLQKISEAMGPSPRPTAQPDPP
jgi:hypothetical protein